MSDPKPSGIRPPSKIGRPCSNLPPRPAVPPSPPRPSMSKSLINLFIILYYICMSWKKLHNYIFIFYLYTYYFLSLNFNVFCMFNVLCLLHVKHLIFNKNF